MSAGAQPEALPAYLFAESVTAGLRVAGLTTLDRLLVAVHRAGVRKIFVVSQGELPSLARSRALGVSFTVLGEPGPAVAGALVASTGVLIHPEDVRTCLAARARLVGVGGRKLPIGYTEQVGLSVSQSLNDTPEVSATRFAALIENHASAKAAERGLWASLASSSDGLVDRFFNRPLGRVLSKGLIHTPVSPNLVSVVSILIGLISAFFFAVGQSSAAILGALLFQLSAIIDCVDGDIARVLFKESPLGKWLDLAGDQLVHVAVFAGITAGVMRAGESPSFFWLGMSAVAGALLSFAVVVRGMRRRPAEGENGALQRLIDAATNRDFSVVVLALALVHRLEWFLWMAAIGSHLFWMTALALQCRTRPARKLAA